MAIATPMTAVVLHDSHDTRVEPRPVPGPGEVLLKVHVTSVCMTDVQGAEPSGA